MIASQMTILGLIILLQIFLMCFDFVLIYCLSSSVFKQSNFERMILFSAFSTHALEIRWKNKNPQVMFSTSKWPSLLIHLKTGWFLCLFQCRSSMWIALGILTRMLQNNPRWMVEKRNYIPNIKTLLVGGFNPIWKIWVKIWIFPK